MTGKRPNREERASKRARVSEPPVPLLPASAVAGPPNSDPPGPPDRDPSDHGYRGGAHHSDGVIPNVGPLVEAPIPAVVDLTGEVLSDTTHDEELALRCHEDECRLRWEEEAKLATRRRKEEEKDKQQLLDEDEKLAKEHQLREDYESAREIDEENLPDGAGAGAYTAIPTVYGTVVTAASAAASAAASRIAAVTKDVAGTVFSTFIM